jgi:hypothetical protein
MFFPTRGLVTIVTAKSNRLQRPLERDLISWRQNEPDTDLITSLKVGEIINFCGVWSHIVQSVYKPTIASSHHQAVQKIECRRL